MKKLLFIILLCFDFVAFNQATIFHNEVFIDDFQSMHIQKGYHSEKLIFSKIAKGYDNQTFYEKLSRLAEKSGVNLFVYPDMDKAQVYCYFNDENLFKQVSLSKVSMHSFHEKKQKQSQTKSPESSIQSIYQISPDIFVDQLIVTEREKSKGIETFISYLDSDIPDFRNGYEFNLNSDQTVFEDLRKNEFQSKIKTCLLQYVFMSIFVLTITFAYIMNNAKTYGIKKSLGISANKLYKDDILEFTFLSFGSFFVVSTICYVLNAFDFSIFIWFFFFHILILFIISIVFALGHFSIHRQNGYRLMKGKVPLKTFIFMNGIFKILLSAILMSIFFESSHALQNLIPYLMQKDAYVDKYQDYIVFENNPNSYDATTLNRVYAALKDEFQVNYWSERSIRQGNASIPSIHTNAVYLKKNPLYDLQTNKIHVKQSEDAVWVGIPEMYYEAAMDGMNRIDLCSSGETINIFEESINQTCDFQKIKNYQKIDSFFPTPSSANMKLTSAVVTTMEVSIGDDELFMDTSLPGNQKDRILEKLKNSDIPSSNYNILSYEDVYNKITSANPDIVMFYSNRIIIVLILLCFIIFQIISTYITMNQKHIFVKYLHGYSNFQIFKKFVFLEGLGNFISAVIFTCIIKSEWGDFGYQIDAYFWWIVILYTLIESLVMLVALKHLKQKDIGNQLKGAD